MKHSKGDAAKNLGAQRAESKATRRELSAEPPFTRGPWCVQKLNHVAGDLWLQIGLPSGWGPIAGITGDDTAEPTFKPVAGMKYLVTPEREQWANARLIATAPALYDALQGLVFRHVKDYGPCFCERVHTDPIEHYDDCVKANAALALANGVTSDESEGEQ